MIEAKDCLFVDYKREAAINELLMGAASHARAGMYLEADTIVASLDLPLGELFQRLTRVNNEYESNIN